MPTLTGTLSAITGAALDPARVLQMTVRAPYRRASLADGSRLVSSVPEPVEVSPTGAISIDLEPGPAVLVVEAVDGRDVYELHVTADMTELTQALAESAPDRSWTESQMVQLKAGAAEEARKAELQRIAADLAAAEARGDREAIEALRAELVEAAEQNAAPHLTKAALNATYGTKPELSQEAQARVTADADLDARKLDADAAATMYVTPEQVQPAVAEAIGSNQTVVNAAAAAVSSTVVQPLVTASLSEVIGPMGSIESTTKNVWPDPKPSGSTLMTSTNSAVSYGPSNDRFLRITASADNAAGISVQSNPRPPWPTGSTKVTVTAEVRSATLASARLQIVFLVESTAYPLIRTDYLPIGPQWVRLAATFDVAPDADNYRLTFVSALNAKAGDVLDVRNIGVINSANADFFDGDTLDSGADEYAWAGAAGASTSTRVHTELVTPFPNGQTASQAYAGHESRLASVESSVGGTTLVPAVAPIALRRIPTPKVYRLPGRRFVTGLNVGALRPPAGATYWVSPTGGGNGASRAAPTTLADALAKADVGTIMMLAGSYPATLTATGKSINYIAADLGVVVSHWVTAPAWTAGAGSVVTATLNAPASVVADTANPVDGLWRGYVKRNTPAEITGPGEFAADGNTVHVRPIGSTVGLKVSTGLAYGILHSGGTAYIDGVDFQAAPPRMTSGTLVWRNCTSRYAPNNALTAVNALIISERVQCDESERDGFNYHETAGGQCDFIEIDCSARRNGWGRIGTCNASTSHETSRGIRLNFTAADCHGPLLADVNDAQTWTLGPTTDRTDPALVPVATQSGHFHSDGNATMYVDSPVTTGAGRSFVVTNGATMRVREEDARAATLSAVAGTLTRYS